MKDNLKFRSSIVCCFTLLFGFNIVNAQTPAFQWAKNFGGSTYDYGEAITVDASGNVYTTGYFEGTVDFDPGQSVFNLTSTGQNQDIFVLKLDVSGNFVWAKQIAGNWVYGIVLDNTGNVYAAGDGFITKLDASGNLSWTKNPGGSVNEIKVDASGNIYTTGSFVQTSDFDPGPGQFNLTSSGYQDIFISKLDASGNFIWAKSFGAASYDFGQSITVDQVGNVYTTGCFSGVVDFDPGVGSFTLATAGINYDVFILKLDPVGNYLWVKSFAGNMGSISSSLLLDANDNVYTTGRFWGTTDFDPDAGIYNLTSAGKTDVFISKLSPSGNFMWAGRVGGDSSEYCNALALDAFNHIYAAGYSGGYVDFDPGPGIFALLSQGAFILNLDDLGNFTWAKNFPAIAPQGYSTCSSIAIDLSANILTTGGFMGAVDFDPGTGMYSLTGSGQEDIFIHKLSQPALGVTESVDLNTPQIYPNPTTGIVNFKFRNNSEPASIKITTAYGTLITEKNGADQSGQYLDLSAQSSGIYFVEIKEGENITRTKIIKK